MANAGTTGIWSLASLKGIFLVLDSNLILGIKTLLPLNFPAMTVAYRLYLIILVTFILVPLQSPYFMLRFLSNMTIAPSLSLKDCRDIPVSCSVLRNS